MMVGIYARRMIERQGLNSKLRELRKYCQIMNWEYRVYLNLDELLDDVKARKIGTVMIKNLDEVFMGSISKMWEQLNCIVDCGCRFVSLEERIDSNKLMWETSVTVAMANSPTMQKNNKGKGRPKIEDVNQMSRTTKWRRRKLEEI
jgi:hypothetical protein